MRGCNIEDNTRTTARETRDSFLECGVSAYAPERVVKRLRWLGYVAGNMRATALAQADHPSKLESGSSFSKGVGVWGVQSV